MKKIIIVAIFLISLCSEQQTLGQYIDIGQASVIADKWIQMVIDKYGGWGTSEYANALPMQEFRNKGRLIGYFCQVNPRGYIIVSLRKELAPVKATSEKDYFDPSEEGGITELIRYKMTSLIDAIEAKFGSIESAVVDDVESLCEISYPEQWDAIENYVVGTFTKESGSSDNYIQGQELLSTSWNQYPPFNNACPEDNCVNTSNGRDLVGCVATAGAQLMRYWAFPPHHNGGSFLYDWRNMTDEVYTFSPQVEQNAVATISVWVGYFLDMNYGCTSSTASTDDMSGIYHDYFYYYQCGRVERENYYWLDWYNLIISQINVNRPIHYRITEHSIVCDGWRNFGTPEYHMNYGWITASDNTWYTIDALPQGGIDEEFMIINILPVTSLQGSLNGNFFRDPAFPVRYVDINASGYNGVFDPGQYIQFLKGTTIKGTGNDLGVRFYGGSGLVTILCTDGKYDEGIKVVNGGMKLRNNGMVYVP